MSQLSRSPQLPPRVPPDVDDISRAICLLGNRIASDLKDKTKVELISLLGTYPSQEQAKYWKQALKRILKEGIEPELLFQEDAAPAAAAPRSSNKSSNKSANKSSNKSSANKSTQKKSPRRKSFDEKPKRFDRNPPSKLQQLHKKQLASNEYLHSGVSNLSGIDLDLLREDEDWEVDFGF